MGNADVGVLVDRSLRYTQTPDTGIRGQCISIYLRKIGEVFHDHLQELRVGQLNRAPGKYCDALNLRAVQGLTQHLTPNKTRGTGQNQANRRIPLLAFPSRASRLFAQSTKVRAAGRG